MIDVLIVPQRLKYINGKPESHDVLHRLLAQVMIDAVHLFSIKPLLQVLSFSGPMPGLFQTAFL